MLPGWIYHSPADNWPRYRPQPSPRCQPCQRYSNPFPWSQRPMDRRRNKSGIANQRGRNRYFRNRNGTRAERARACSRSNSEPEEPTSKPSYTFPFILPEDDFKHPEPTFSLPRLPRLRLYYRISAKYWSWFRKHRRRRKKCAP